MAIAYLGIGSNMGNRRRNMARACSFLRKSGFNILKISTLIETSPVDCPPKQRAFLNGVLKMETDLSPDELLTTLQGIEYKLGRVRTVINGPRPIDLDILLYDELRVRTPRLTIPHPRMTQRDFVMRPLLEIAPELSRDFCYARD